MVGLLVSGQRETSWKWSWANRGTIPAFAWRKWRKPISTSERTAGVAVTSPWALSQPGRSSTSRDDYSCATNSLFILSTNKKLRYRTDNTSPLDPVLSNISPVNNPRTSFADPIILPAAPIDYIATDIFPSRLQAKFFLCISLYSTRATCPTNTVLLLWNALITLAKSTH